MSSPSISQPEAQDAPGDLLEWTRYFDELDDAMHDFEVGLSRQDVGPLRDIEVPAGHPPQILHTRWAQAYQRITELEFRARALREELRAEFSRFNSARRFPHPHGGGYGSIDISG